MSTDSSPAIDADRFPYDGSRRRLLGLLGSALALGTMSGLSAGRGAGQERTHPVAHGKPSVDVTGLSLTDNQFRVEQVEVTAPIDGEPQELFVFRGIDAIAYRDTVQRLDVDDVEIHEDVDDLVTGVLGMLANQDLDHRVEGLPPVVQATLDGIDRRQVEQVLTVVETWGLDNTIEYYVTHTSRFEDRFGAVLDLILVLVILLVIVGAGFGGG